MTAKRPESSRQVPESTEEGQSTGGFPFGTIALFVVVGVIGVQFARNNQETPRRGWRPKLNIKFVTDEEMALTAVRGSTKLDQLVALRQKQASANKGDPAVWVALGRAWMQKARVQKRPSLYRYVRSSVRVALSRAPRFASALALQATLLSARKRLSSRPTTRPYVRASSRPVLKR